MILIALACFLTFAFFYSSRQLPYLLIIYFVLYDMFDGFYKDDKIYSILRYVLPLLLILFYMIQYQIQKKLDAIFVVLLAYLVILWVANAGDQIVTARVVLSVVITLLMIPIGKHFAERKEFTREFEKYNRFLLIAIPLYIIYANKAGIGGFYTDAFSTGFLITSRMYIVPIVVFFAIHYALTNKDKSWFLKAVEVFFILINICILVINTRRTTFGMLAAAIVVYTMFNRRLFFKMVMLVFILMGALILTYPLYEARLTAQLEKRQRIENIDTYDEEGRYLETLYLIDYHQKKGDLGEILFGIQLFDTYDFGTKYFGRDRPIHSDINMLFFSTGLVGLFLFFLFFYHFFFRRRSLIARSNKILYYPLLINFLIVLLPGRFIGTLTYAPLLMLLMTTLKYAQPVEEEVQSEELELVPTLSH